MANDAHPLEFFKFQPQWGLPSSCAECVAVELYLNMAKIQAETIVSKYPYSSLGDLPVLRWGKYFASGDGCIQFLRKNFSDLDRKNNLSTAQYTDTFSWCTFIQQHLVPAMDYFLWVVPENYEKVTMRIYGAETNLPLRPFLRYHRRLQINSELEKRGIITVSQAEELLRKSLKVLSDRLGTQTYFFGSSASSVDVALAAHVAVLYHAPLPEGGLREMLNKDYPNLVRHAQALLLAHIPSYQPVAEAKGEEKKLEAGPAPAYELPAADASSKFDYFSNVKVQVAVSEKKKAKRVLSPAEEAARRRLVLCVGLGAASVVGLGILSKILAKK